MRDGSGGAGGGAGRYGTDGVVFGAAAAATLTFYRTPSSTSALNAFSVVGRPALR